MYGITIILHEGTLDSYIIVTISVPTHTYTHANTTCHPYVWKYIQNKRHPSAVHVFRRRGTTPNDGSQPTEHPFNPDVSLGQVYNRPVGAGRGLGEHAIHVRATYLSQQILVQYWPPKIKHSPRLVNSEKIVLTVASPVRCSSGRWHQSVLNYALVTDKHVIFSSGP